ncbi:LysE family translocator [Siculibacillus lacustris]|uniref:LysE family translocator n=1 Tax=Siculibacillus lacustris TaxID=1549641 RepID=A0A4Q9VIX5_9HYPH|nr:LysE family translocator [Siculibacillus lacustris]TBW34301.1 LysE family translocator [Siculibacillus lacustris]
MTVTTVLIFAGALFLNAGTPGPSIAALVAQVLNRGARPVLPFVAAMWIGEAAWLGLAVAGLSVLASELHLLFVAIKWAGIAYLVHLAVAMWRTPADDAGLAPPVGGAARLFATGLALTLGNPKIMVFYLALLPSLVDLPTLGVIDWAELTAVQIAVMAACDLAWMAAAARARGWLASPRALRLTRRIGAVAMGGAAVTIAARS